MENFNSVLEKAERRFHELKPYDRYAQLNQFRFKAQEGKCELVPFKNTGGLQTVSTLELQEHALRQLCTRIGVPFSFFKKCPSALQELNTAWFMQNLEADKEVMLRIVKESQVRAILSDRYAPFDDIELFRILSEFMDGSEEVKLQSFEDKSSHVRITWPSENVEVQPGDIVERGIHIANSEVGMRSVTIIGIVHRLKCKNGLVAKEKRGGIRHIGDPERIKAGVRDVIEEVKNDSSRLLERFRKSLEREIEKPVEMIEQISKDHELSQDEYKAILDSFMSEPSRNLFGVVNAVSNSAQVCNDMDRRFEIESLAGKVLDVGLAA